MDHLIVDQKNLLMSPTQKIRIQKEALFGTTASKYHFLRMLLSISVIYASVLCETHCSAHSLGLSFHPPPNNERVEFIVRSLAASVIKPDCNQKGGGFLSERRRGASSLAACIHDSAQKWHGRRTTHHSLMRYYPHGSATQPLTALQQYNLLVLAQVARRALLFMARRDGR